MVNMRAPGVNRGHANMAQKRHLVFKESEYPLSWLIMYYHSFTTETPVQAAVAP